jgi:hypothetical protein
MENSIIGTPSIMIDIQWEVSSVSTKKVVQIAATLNEKVIQKFREKFASRPIMKRITFDEITFQQKKKY